MTYHRHKSPYGRPMAFYGHWRIRHETDIQHHPVSGVPVLVSIPAIGIAGILVGNVGYVLTDCIGNHGCGMNMP